MQVGGNGKARAFFRANGGETNDKQVKYNSRAANLYKAKIQKLVSFFSLKLLFFFFVCLFRFVSLSRRFKNEKKQAEVCLMMPKVY